VNALAALDPTVPDMVALAQSMPTDTLRAMYAEGTRPEATSPLWVDTLYAVGLVLAARRRQAIHWVVAA
jgi:hypothetical protein